MERTGLIPTPNNVSGVSISVSISRSPLVLNDTYLMSRTVTHLELSYTDENIVPLVM